ncbi:DNA polymerase IV [Lentimicrobium sp.]|jgi:DNA polymerase-4|uniref:DNA polymerase IV n=1 Tax=Lentimicrobium sp. TaxID=2034841 RepID=UPI002B574E18|nr:DNA polymerase IV [Lentimicrobium sp.]HOP14849.1 DNA polymerase IV [Lentimicrobium sp.]HPF65325.1 DNA polymerase IV [Lentimicrobium sp.]HPJ62717.1 DNA polymerase IV [Lentimicrobium sp.]
MTVPGDNRTIVHMDLDTFFVSVERLGNSRLNGLPVIIGGMSDRGVVAGCSYEARTFGVHSAMPMRMARALCPDAVVIRGDMEQYTRYSNMVTTIIAEEAPVYEKASIDEHYLDITGMDRFFGSVKWSHELRQRIIRETGLPISLGLSVNKTVSKIATGQAKPNGELEIPRDRVMPFLSPLSISKIPGIGEKTFHLLRSMGIANIDTLSRMPVEMVERLLGKNGIIIWKKANGIDPAPVEPYSERKSISSETTFEQDTINIGMINDLLLKKVEKLAWELRRKQKLASCVTVKVRYANFDTHTLQQRIPYTAFDHILLPVTRSLFNRLYQRRMLIRLVGVRFSHLVSGVQQISMFDDSPETISLYQAMDRIRNRFGQRAVTRAATMGTVVVEEDE